MVMAKTIIKNTMVDPIEMTCDECKSVFSYNYQDIESEKALSLFGLCPEYTRFVVCPVCKHRNDLDKVKVEVSSDESDNSDN
jgi:hypothetical protein